MRDAPTAFRGEVAAPRGGRYRRECGVTSVFASGKNLDAGAIHLPRADEIEGAPGRPLGLLGRGRGGGGMRGEPVGRGLA